MKYIILLSLGVLLVLIGSTTCEKRPTYLPPPPPRKCRPDPKCRDIACPLFVCPYGNDPLACTCCPTCLKGPTESCGGPKDREGRCTEDHICVDKILQEIPSSNKPRTPVGTCRSRFCPDCALVECAPDEFLKCEKGIIKDPFCGCCNTCRKELDEKCGGSEGGCPREEGLVCKDAQGQEIFYQETGLAVGTCGFGDGIPIPASNDPIPEGCPNCAVVLCAIPKCDHGTEIDPICGCCPVCKKGLGEYCGGKGNKDGSCGDGFICGNFKCVKHVYDGDDTDVKPATLIAYANNFTPSEPYGPPTEECPNCAEIACSPPKCDHGTEIDPRCGCCLVCRKGLGESCGGEGNVDGTCGDEFNCENSRCVKRKIKPGCLDCRLVKPKCISPESLGCPNNYRISDCTCCPECIRKYPG